MESAYQKTKTEKLLNRTTAALFALSAVCFMIYTTELHYAHAEGEEDLGSASVPINASVTVGTACNFSSNVDNQHNATITNGVNSTDIGKTTLNVTCNDQGGYAVYAIGYTNDEYGNTSLKSSISDDYNISTGTSTSGSTSNWSMKLSTVPGTTTATIENDYNAYHTVPDDYTKVATLNTITNPDTSTTGSSISTTYQAYISPTQPAGTYSGKVKYTLVHPSTAHKPEVPPPYMQDTATIKSKLANIGDSMQVIDKRDNKTYWIAKLADGNIWMTQNLDLCIGCEDAATLTSENTDLNTNENSNNAYTDGYSFDGDTIIWSPTAAANSIEGGDTYIYSSNSTSDDIVYNSLSECTTAGHSAADCSHYHVGDYYNWATTIASNGNIAQKTSFEAENSICPKGWKLPSADSQNSGFGELFLSTGIAFEHDSADYTFDEFNTLRTEPYYLTRGGMYSSSTLSDRSQYGYYWGNKRYYSYDPPVSPDGSYYFKLGVSSVSFGNYGRYGRVIMDKYNNSLSIRCVTR